ncbi:10615_t:CDS:2 [Gigaspora margarita]|uniref:10615_t:CDS:1 n=1 Tax=Gigaspora margarita TaxID=4874 RepID=A0ABN7VFF7_GIGMA|nr:10615_t:CDS:2 [Gigaspora margarita]
MTYRFFTLNNEELPGVISRCLIASSWFNSMAIFLQIGSCIGDSDTLEYATFAGLGFWIIPVYIIQTIIQVYFKDNFPSTGSMLVFQWISILSILFSIPIFILFCVRGECNLFVDGEGDDKEMTRFYAFLLYPVIFQLYLHVGYRF